LIEIGHLVARLGCVEHLEEREPVDRDGGVVLGDDILLRNVDHLLHDVDLAADAIEERHDQVEAGVERARVAAKPFDGPVIALPHRFDAGEDRQDDEQNEDDDEDVDPEQHLISLRQSVKYGVPLRPLEGRRKALKWLVDWVWLKVHALPAAPRALFSPDTPLSSPDLIRRSMSALPE